MYIFVPIKTKFQKLSGEKSNIIYCCENSKYYLELSSVQQDTNQLFPPD